MSVRRRTTLRAVAAATVVVALAAGCSNANSGANKGGGAAGVLTLGKPDGPQTNNSNPFLTTSAGAVLGYRHMIYEPLAMTNMIRPTEKADPWLATEWAWEDNFTKVTFTLDDRAKWADGKPLTAADVEFTFNLLKEHPALNGDGVPFDGVAVKGKQVVLTFEESQFVNQNKIIQTFIVPKHIWEKVENPETWPNRTPVGSGPYKLKTFTPQTTTLTATPTYWNGDTKVKELRYTAYNDNSAATTALATGKMEWSFVFMPNHKQLFIDKDPKNHQLWFPSGLGIHGLWFNTTRKPFDNPALRKAMAMVVDRKAIHVQAQATLYPEITNPTGIPLPAGEPFLAPEYEDATTKPDVAGAKKVLAEAGFKLSGGVLKDPGGKPVTLTFTDPAGWNDYITGLAIIKDNIKEIGIEAKVKTQTAEAWGTDVANGNFDATLHWTNSGATPYDMYQNIMDGAIVQPIGKSSQAGNFGRFKNAEATAALKEYANATTDAARTKALNTLQKIFVEQAPMIPTAAAPIGAEFSTKNWIGWPSEANPYAPPQHTQRTALEIVLNLKPSTK
ncbi:peptide ABC transporter substrate-binding protein [Streptomyces sp. TSRI0445]|uniref:ABC transporter, substrate-binding protein (Cluster 5, nickel/peptides/opines) n=1 Tax=Streptomyces globisporus TaxID=1908 RepID=A0ABN8USN9_STRGL|nr:MULTISPECIES: ABC transporter substrate-binding protein [Streptomyces]OKI71940.1 peptide ABC transporter substrate-binding protein [Streptomyces sp. TSRI0445]RDL08375.1 peptide/nickel transport system substrate-binding protein [Streptomyces sp. HB202]UIZ15672.1 ABC transporter substrate-binding protein [Streptomyces sp. R527F]CAH9413215.1 ABC transporter, substrate-binding protein (cluster 5, nickel/peptides/opines) [Streptomyces globisporus]GGV98350.1 peptide ABC transporter substrate-bind